MERDCRRKSPSTSLKFLHDSMIFDQTLSRNCVLRHQHCTRNAPRQFSLPHFSPQLFQIQISLFYLTFQGSQGISEVLFFEICFLSCVLRSGHRCLQLTLCHLHLVIQFCHFITRLFHFLIQVIYCLCDACDQLQKFSISFPFFLDSLNKTFSAANPSPGAAP